jgi:hypothetical protein
MSDRRNQPTTPKANSEPKKAKKTETTILTPDELKAIAGGLGGAQQPPPPITPGVKPGQTH